MTTQKLVTEALGFELSAEIEFGDFPTLGAHRCYEEVDSGKVQAGTPHRIQIKEGLDAETLCMVASHEVYHLFKSVSHLVAVEDECEAETFGELVRMIFKMGRKKPMEVEP